MALTTSNYVLGCMYWVVQIDCDTENNGCVNVLMQMITAALYACARGIFVLHVQVMGDFSVSN